MHSKQWCLPSWGSAASLTVFTVSWCHSVIRCGRGAAICLLESHILGFVCSCVNLS